MTVVMRLMLLWRALPARMAVWLRIDATGRPRCFWVDEHVGVGRVLFLSGPSCAGKSTTARAWADAQDGPTACIDVDELRLLVRTGRARPDLRDDDPGTPAQWLSACEIAAHAARVHASRGLHVVIDVYAPPAPPGTPGLPRWDELLAGLDVLTVHLVPDYAVRVRRNLERGDAAVSEVLLRKNSDDYEWCVTATNPPNVLDATTMTVADVLGAIDRLAAAPGAGV